MFPNSPISDPCLGASNSQPTNLERCVAFDLDAPSGVVRQPNITKDETPLPYSPYTDRPLHGQDSNPPPIEFQKEKFIHRQMAYMAASGMSQREIATAIDMTPMNVSYVFRQRWFQTLVYELIESNQRSALDLLTGAVKDSIWTLIDLSQNAKNEAVKKSAASDIVDRVCGKPAQFIETKQSLTVNDSKAADEEIARLQDELNYLVKKN